MKKILLTGKHSIDSYTIVDDDIYEKLGTLKWFARPDRIGNLYAVRTLYLGGGRKNTKHDVQLLHRLVIGAKKGECVDHINHDTLDNRRSNLRIATIAQNAQNRGKQRNNTSGYKGVQRSISNRQKTVTWRAQIHKDGKRINLGNYKTPQEAYQVYCKAAKKLHGEFAHL